MDVVDGRIKFKIGDHVRPMRPDFHKYQGVIERVLDNPVDGVICEVSLDHPFGGISIQALHQDILELVPFVERLN